MTPDPAAYRGREQAYVKHHFLSTYLERLVHKTASRFDHIVYIDGFSGPWQSKTESYDDTSFGIALSQLRAAKASWGKLNRSVKMSAFLVEKDRKAFRHLSEVPARYPDIAIHPLSGDFLDQLPTILHAIPHNAFVFALIDPKGWRIPVQNLSALLGRENTEIVFNFMFDFINRAASMSAPDTIRGLDELLPGGQWRDDLKNLNPSAAPGARKQILVESFSETLARLGSFQYVAEVPVLRPVHDRVLYSLIYATRKPTGLEVFRDCQIATLKKEAELRGTTKITTREESSKQAEMFRSLADLAPDNTADYLNIQKRDAERAIRATVPRAPDSLRYDKLWPSILARYAIRRVEVGALVGKLHAAGDIISPDWGSRKRVPEADYRLSRP